MNKYKSIKRKSLSLLLVVALVIAMAVPAFALSASTNVEIEDELYIDFYELGFVEVMDYADLLYLLEDELAREGFIETQRLMNIQAPAIAAYNVLMYDFWTEVNGNWDFVFPDNYAGAYVKYDTLIILLTDISEDAIAFYVELLGTDVSVVFEQVDFSWNQLTSFGEVFVEAVTDTAMPITGFGVDTMTNSFIISLDKTNYMSTDFINDFNITTRFLPIPIVFELDEPLELYSLQGGTEITRHGRLGGFSVGLTGARRGQPWQPVLLTTGHAFPNAPVGTEVRRNNQPIGTLASYRVGQFSAGNPGTVNGDWAIIHLNSTGAQMVTNQIRSGQRIQGIVNTSPVGTLVRGTGSRTLSWAGTVQRVNFDAWAPQIGTTITGLTKVDYQIPTASVPTGGDSGGTIWTISSNQNLLAGVLVGSYGSDRWLFSPMQWSWSLFQL